MELKGKKQVNGKNVAVIDTQGANIADIAEAMESNGWDFDVVRASYAAKDGTKKHKDVPVSKIGAVYAKYNIDNWAVRAHKGAASLTAQISNSKGAMVVKQSSGGALKDLCALHVVASDAAQGGAGGNAKAAGAGKEADGERAHKRDRVEISSIDASEDGQGAQDVEETMDIPTPKVSRPRKKSPKGAKAKGQGARANAPDTNVPARDGANRQAAPGHQGAPDRVQGAPAPATAPASDPSAGGGNAGRAAGAPRMTQVQKEARRAAGRRADDTQIKRVIKNKHSLMLVLSVILIFTPGIVFGAWSTWDIVQGRKIALESPAEAEKRFKLARFYIVLAVLCIVVAVAAWNLPALIDWLKGAGIL